MIRALSHLLVFAGVLAFANPGFAQTESLCFAIAKALPGAQYASLAGPVAVQVPEVEITYVGHSTFLIRSQAGVTAATDYAGYAGPGVIPTIVTMNHAHSSHFTPVPDPAIPHVLRGWNPQGGPAEHHLKVDDVLVRNVPTDIRSYGQVEVAGNSIFIFEVGGLCIGHLGHLHHMLTEDHYAAIGRLDILMVPVDGSMTMDVRGMIKIAERLRARIILPMHVFDAGGLSIFLSAMDESFKVDFAESRTLTVSLRALPREPTVIVMP